MTPFHARVAGLRVDLLFHGAPPAALRRYVPFVCSPGPADVVLVLRPGELEPDCRFTGRIAWRGGLWRAEGAERLGSLDPATGRGEGVADPAMTIADAFVRAALAWSVAARRGALFHAAAVRVDAAAHLVPGRSGAGKSTFASRAGHALTDEVAAVVSSPGGFEVHGTPWWRSSSGSAPLERVLALAWDDPSIEPLPRPALLRHLATNLVLPFDGPAERAAAFRVCGDIAAKVPFARVSFRPDTAVDDLLRRFPARRAA
jgi:hypothetical protein